MNKCEQLALEQCIKELHTMTLLSCEALQVSGYQELCSQLGLKVKQLNEVFKELTEAKPCD